MKQKSDFQKGLDFLFDGDKAWFESVVMAAYKRRRREFRPQGRS